MSGRCTVAVERPSWLTCAAIAVSAVTIPMRPKCSGTSSRARIDTDTSRTTKSTAAPADTWKAP
jgi:hypothetical protein